MSLKKTLAIATAAAALAAISVPVMAFENEIHGTSRLRLFFSNYEQGGGGNPLSTSATGTVGVPVGNNTNNLYTNNYFEQRSRLFYTAKASDDLKLVTAFEIDSVFGDRAQGGTVYGSTVGAAPTAATQANAAGSTGRGQGGALESDTVNLETKWVYLDFKIPSTTTRVSAGIMPFKDQIKGIFLDADIAGVLTNSKFDNVAVQAGYMRAYDKTYFTYTTGNDKTGGKGQDTLTVGALQAQFALSKDANIGGAYYIWDDARGNVPGFGTDFQAHVVALTGDVKLNKLALSGFLAYQGGIIKDFTPGKSAYLNAYAINAAAKMPAGPGTFKTAILYTSGNNASDSSSTHLKGWVGTTQVQNNAWSATTGTSTYNESGMMLLNRNAAAGTGTTDYAIAYNTGNGSSPAGMQGMYLYTLGYDATITPKVYLNTNLGFLWAAKSNTSVKAVDTTALASPIVLAGETAAQHNARARNATNFQGAELNVEAGYKMYDNLTLSMQAAYVMLGGYYNNASFYQTGKDVENPYTVRTSLIFNF